jgi:arsenate reductase
LIERIGLTPSDLLSKRSRPYQALGLAAKQSTDDDLLRLMVEHPALIRRPLIVRDRQAVVGFDQKGLARLIAKSAAS